MLPCRVSPPLKKLDTGVFSGFLESFPDVPAEPKETSP